MKIIDASQLAEIAMARGINIDDLVQATEHIAQIIADDDGIELHDVSCQPGFGGLCATFRKPGYGVACPEDIDAADPSGDWDD